MMMIRIKITGINKQENTVKLIKRKESYKDKRRKEQIKNNRKVEIKLITMNSDQSKKEYLKDNEFNKNLNLNLITTQLFYLNIQISFNH